jgi:hypothetical protein
VAVIELLTSDTAILVATVAGLALTTLSIFRDARTQREREASAELAVGAEDLAA